MWTLECDGTILSNKKIWLRPGKIYLFGRTLEQKGRNSGFRIDNKSVSRKHVTLSVSGVKTGEGSSANARSEITIKDEDTKFRTEIDGESVKNETRILKKDEHVFRLGKSDQVFRIKWQPVILTFSLSSKEMKAGPDPLLSYRRRLEDLDIKTVIPYVISATTHVVSSKRNTAKGLQALINSKCIVSESFIDALVYVTTPTDLDADESLSPLEQDFTSNWPNAFEHLPAKSKEPSERPAEDFRPNPQREAVFDGYTFVFFEQIQFETLQAPIANGGGKALQYALKPGETSAEEIVRYVKGIAGEKGLGEFEDGGKGVVLVKFRCKNEQAEWAAELVTHLALSLDQRLIEQSEFLDAILANDAGMLRQRLQLEEADSNQAPSTSCAAVAEATAVEADGSPRIEPTQAPPRQARVRGTIVSRFKGFDDDDDYEMAATPRPAPVESQMDSALIAGKPQNFSYGDSFANEDSMDVDAPSQVNGDTQAINPRKRAAPSSDEEEEKHMIDKLLPAATAMKRRKKEEAEEAERNGVPAETSFSLSKSQTKPEPVKKRKPKKEVDIKEMVREGREAEEEAGRRDEENLRDTLGGMTVEEMKNLAVVEEVELPARREQPQRINGEHDDRWDERWNGRRNFKKFRRRGEGTQARRGQSVIVPLEEVKRKDFGIGEDYWLEKEKTKKTQKEKTRNFQSQSQQTPHTTANSLPVEMPSELVMDDGSNLPEAIDIDSQRTTRHHDQTQPTDESSNRSRAANGKRAAASQVAGQPAKKKRKKFAAAISDSE